MCGIAGWANLDSSKPPMFGDEMVLQSMCDSIWHRGPDSEGVWLGTGVSLVMVSLNKISTDHSMEFDRRGQGFVVYLNSRSVFVEATWSRVSTERLDANSVE